MVAMLRGGVREVKVPERPGAEGLEMDTCRAGFTGKQVLAPLSFRSCSQRCASRELLNAVYFGTET